MRTYTVRPGDTLGRISRSVYGDAAHWRRLASANALDDPNHLFVGQILRIPPLADPATPVVRPPDAAAARLARAALRSTAQVASLAPALGARADRLLRECAAGGVRLAVKEGLRTWEKQDRLFAQGRTAPGAVVTMARGGSSYHNFGLAFDVVVLDRQGWEVWDPAHPDWRLAADVGKRLGLAWGGDWRSFRDIPHFERRGNLGLERCRQLFAAAGIRAIWLELGG